MLFRSKRYAEGDLIEDESEYGVVTPEQKQAGRDANSFGDAFKDARASGEKTFTWKGKTYTTELASDKPKATKKFSASESIGVSAPKKSAGFMSKALGYKSGGSVSSASKRGDGIAQRGKTKGRFV